MGGSGSTRWDGYTPRTTVENCRALCVYRLAQEGAIGPGVHWSGLWCWTDAQTGERRASVGCEVSPAKEDFSVLKLKYTFAGESEPVRMQVLLMPTSPHFGGLRFWFICPLVVSGSPCNWRVAKLYLPPGGRYFGCRHCYDLTYTSSQEAHEHDVLFKWIARQRGYDFEALGMASRHMLREARRRSRWL